MGGPPPAPPFRIADPSASARRGAAGVVVSRARAAVLRLITPALADLLAQLERERDRARAELGRLEERVARLERERES